MASAKRKRTALMEVPDLRDLIAVRVVRLGNAILTRMTVLLEAFGVTPLQFNVLRILYVRDVEEEGLPVGVVGAALVTPMPDVTRLVDRLEKIGLVERVRKSDDRRVVRIRLTKKGFDLVERIQGPLVAHHQALLGDLSKAEVERISNDLARLADSIERAKPH